jgi:hypothetical protein
VLPQVACGALLLSQQGGLLDRHLPLLPLPCCLLPQLAPRLGLHLLLLQQQQH